MFMYLYQEIREKLIGRVLGMESNVRIPSRAELCNQYMVTRTTIDRVLKGMIRDGYLYAIGGSGTFVAGADTGDVPIKQNVPNIAALVPNILYDTYPEIVRGIEDVTESLGINLVVCNTDNNSDKQYAYIQRLLNANVRGLIIVPAINRNTDFALNELLGEAEIPFVFCNRNIGGVNVPCVCSNDFYGGFQATSHLIEMGYRRIAYLTAMFYKTSMDRYQGYLAALCQHGIPLDEELVCIEDRDSGAATQSGKSMMNALIARRPDVDAAVCFNDRVACGAIEAILENDRKVSEDIGVIGYDNTAICEMLPAKLTSVDYRNYEIGQSAASILYRMMTRPDETPKRIITFAPRLVARASCLGKAHPGV